MDVVLLSCSIDRAGLQDAGLHSVRRDVEKPEGLARASNHGCAFPAFCSEMHAHNGYRSELRLFVIYGNKGNVSFPYGQAFSQHSLATQGWYFSFEHNFIVNFE
jgi:hypothetical protein